MNPNSAKKIRVVLFDVGGVLVELGGVAAIRDWNYRLSEEEIWRLWFASPAVRAFETGKMAADAFAIEMVRELEINLAPDEFLTSFASWPTGLFPGTLALLERIPKRFQRALLSNSNSVHWPRVIDEMGLGSAVDRSFVSHLLGHMKPDETIFRHVLDSLDCAAEQILFLDDNQPNISAAQRLGFNAVHVRGLGEVESALTCAGIFEERI